MSHGLHTITLDLDGLFPSVRRMTCHAPADAPCHAVYDCQCEEYYNPGAQDGKPYHETSDGDRHGGTFDPTHCDLTLWAEEGDEVMRGEVTFPVTASWEGDHYLFHPVPEKDTTPALFDAAVTS